METSNRRRQSGKVPSNMPDEHFFPLFIRFCWPHFYRICNAGWSIQKVAFWVVHSSLNRGDDSGGAEIWQGRVELDDRNGKFKIRWDTRQKLPEQLQWQRLKFFWKTVLRERRFDLQRFCCLGTPSKLSNNTSRIQRSSGFEQMSKSLFFFHHFF